MVNDKILTPADVAEKFGVDPKTVTRWSDRGLIRYFRTPGGHRRYWEKEIQALIDNSYNI